MQTPAPEFVHTITTAFRTAASGSHSRAPRLALDDVEAARARLRGIVAETPCTPCRQPGDEAGVRLFLKRDYLQVTGSFKERGAASALSLLDAGARRRGVVAASAGNHALGLAFHGRRLGVAVTLVMPAGASRVKIERCRRLGARVVLSGDTFEQAGACALELARENGSTLVHPFDDPVVIAGQGTMALEILEQAPEIEAILVPVGGGGLLAGVATAIKAVRPEVAVIAVEPRNASSYLAACHAGAPVTIAIQPTLADGLAVARTGACAFEISRGLVDAVVTVSEVDIAQAMLRLFEVERAPIEGAGATALAALLNGSLASLEGKTVVVPVCGGNVDASTFNAALQLALSTPRRYATAAAG